MFEHLLLSVPVSPPLTAYSTALGPGHLPALPIEAWEAAAQWHLFWHHLMDAGNTNERFNDSQAVLVSSRRDGIHVFDISAKVCAICTSQEINKRN